MKPRIAIIGGGPIGVEAALYSACAGFDEQLFETGERVAANVRRWGFVQVFTEWKRNRSPLAVKLLSEADVALPPDESYSSGDELADYVEKLTQLPPLRGKIHTRTYVVSITREGCLKSDFIGQLLRAHLERDRDRFTAILHAVQHHCVLERDGSGGNLLDR